MEGCPTADVLLVVLAQALFDAAQGPDDLAIPGFRTHPLKADLTGHWSVWVNGNWRITFRFIDSNVELVDYQDYH